MTADVALVLAILMAFAFALTNGILDAANSIATLVATRIARPLPAVAMASVFNLIGPLLFGAAVANSVSKLVTVSPVDTIPVIGAGLTGAVVWNAVAWRRNIPSSSSHALVGGLVGAAMLDAGPRSVNLGPYQDGHVYGVLGVMIGLLVATMLGFVVAFIVERIALRATRRASARMRGPVRSVQWAMSAWLAFSHGSNDAQKTVGIVAGLLFASGNTHSLSAPLPVVLGASVAMTLGTAFGGWGIIKTVGRRIFPIRSLDSLVSQSSSASVIFAASIIGAPVSTSQIVSSSVVGIGVGRARWRHVSWEIVREIAITWVTTMPAAGIIAALSLPIWKSLP